MNNLQSQIIWVITELAFDHLQGDRYLWLTNKMALINQYIVPEYIKFRNMDWVLS